MVEIIVKEVPWIPRQPQIKPETIVDLRIDYGEVELGRKVKATGGKWNPAKRLWEIRYDQAVALDLEPRIQKEKASNTTNRKAQAGIVEAFNPRWSDRPDNSMLGALD
ncbi:MAG TPA: hypothetical protein VJS64_17745 [Pyrinomonadaceae bacterium]|nr:hypothetical protein [Pyrinomonadaceae bacterium]